jgi:GTPase
VLPAKFNKNKKKYWEEVHQKADKIVSIIDLCGHEKYLKTTMFGQCGYYPDYSMIIISSSDGVVGQTKEHLGITIAQGVPFFIVFTKIDTCPEQLLQQNVNTVRGILSSLKRKIVITNDKTDYNALARQVEFNVCPIFLVSSVTGDGINGLIKFIGLLEQRNHHFGKKTDPFKMYINDHYLVPGVGNVVCGLVTQGSCKAQKELLFGPTVDGNSHSIIVKSMHINRMPTDEIHVGDMATVAFRCNGDLNRSMFRKGMFMAEQGLNPVMCQLFWAKINVLYHASSMKPGYQAQMHCGVIVTQVRMIAIRNLDDTPRETLMNGERGKVLFWFVDQAQYLCIGDKAIYRDGRTKLIGEITGIEENKELFN